MAYKRKYRKGAVITSLDELAKQECVYYGNRIVHAEWFMPWQFHLAVTCIRNGWLYYAEKITDERSDAK